MNGTTSTIHYYWGKDLSGTLQGAGGVGGLLYLTIDSAVYVPFYDNNGNITRYLDANGNTVAQYTYDAFGNTISQSGPLAGFFRHRFSTKYFDAETGLYYYGYRFYHPVLMRWLTRDPLEEDGGLNLYAACNNNLVAFYDALGEKWVITRDNKPFATARATSSSDTFQDLARMIRLDVKDYKIWAHTADANPVKCKEYSIPNTIYYHLGSPGITGRWPLSIIRIWTSNNRSAADKYARQGFRVVTEETVTSSTIINALGADGIYRYTFTGHGDGFGGINAHPNYSNLVKPARFTRYGINSLVLQGCGTAISGIDKTGKTSAWRDNVASVGVFVGYGYESQVNLLNESFLWIAREGTNHDDSD